MVQWWYFPCQQQIFGSGVNHYLAKFGHHWNSRISGMATLIFRWNNHNLELAIFNYNISQCESIKRVEITDFQILLTLNPNIWGSSKHFLFTSPCIKHVFWVKSPFFASNLTRPSCFFVPVYQHYEKGFPANVLFNQFRNLQVTISKKNMIMSITILLNLAKLLSSSVSKSPSTLWSWYNFINHFWLY